MDINEVVKKDEYNFLKTNSNISNPMFLTFGGSYAYGTFIPDVSDIDIRGVALNSKKEILLGNDFEQVVDLNTDTTIYSFSKILKLLSNCNPNTIEMLGCKEDSYIFYSDFGKELLENKDMFLSKKAIHAFGGYANAQLRRLQNAINGHSEDETIKEKHILGTLNSMMYDLNSRYKINDNGCLNLFIDKAPEESEYIEEIYLSGYFHKYPLRDYDGLMSEILNVLKQYFRLGRRNKKKDVIHLSKHMMNLMKLFLMCFDILERKEINTYRENDLDFLMSIRNGEYLIGEDKVKPEFFEILDKYETRLHKLGEMTTLPDEPDYERINKFKMKVNEFIITNN